MDKETLVREYVVRHDAGLVVKAVWFDGTNVAAVESVLGGGYAFNQWVNLPHGVRCAILTRPGGHAFAAGVGAWIVAVPSAGNLVLTAEEFKTRYKLPPRRVDLRVQVWVDRDGGGSDGWVLERVHRAIEDGKLGCAHFEVTHRGTTDG